MKDRDDYIVALPPGVGKTRLVWADILRCAATEKEVRQIVRGTLIMLPNQNVRLTWLQELLLYLLSSTAYGEEFALAERDSLEDPGKEWLPKELEDMARSKKVLPKFVSYSFLHSKPNNATFDYCILDEWHKISESKVNSKNSYFPIKARKGIYFVSATPINPVLEGEIIDQEGDVSDDEFEESILAAEQKAVDAISMIKLGRKLPALRAHDFWGRLKSIKVSRWLQKGHEWPAPLPLQNAESIKWPTIIEGLKLRQSITDQAGYHDEYLYMTGLVGTKKHRNSSDGKYHLTTRSTKYSFGFEYKKTFPAPGTKAAHAWLTSAHPRVKSLLELLEAKDVIPERGKKPCSKKAVIFCTHQGIANGLVEIIRGYVGVYGRDSVSTNVATKSFPAIMGKFNRVGSDLKILVLTDAASESYSLHKDCQLLIHYEIPWSPIRLLQRIGRLTRLTRDGEFNKGVEIAHIIMPGGVEEERVSRLIRRTESLVARDLLPHSKNSSHIEYLLGTGPSLVLKEWVKNHN